MKSKDARIKASLYEAPGSWQARRSPLGRCSRADATVQHGGTSRARCGEHLRKRIVQEMRAVMDIFSRGSREKSVSHGFGEISSLGLTRNFTQSFVQQNLFRMCMQTAVWSLGADKSCIYSAHLRTARQRTYRARVGTEIHLDGLARAVSRTLTGPIILMRIPSFT